ncbi:alpha-1,4-N-acetylglucosaminyltransferase-like isoform X2 [Symsagittifera roscoffensis]
METSGKSYLDSRQSCSVESAALKSELISKVLFKSPTLDLSKSDSLCELYYNYDNVEFYTTDLGELLRGTSAEGLEERVARVVEHRTVHYSDIARMAAGYKYGGTYLDLDVIVLRSLKHLKDYIVIENGKPALLMSHSDSPCNIPEKSQRGRKINPGQFHFTAGHQFPWAVLEDVNRTYDAQRNDRGQTGPRISSRVAKKMYHIRELLNTQLTFSEGIKNFSIIPDFTYMAASFSRIKEELWPRRPRSELEWNRLFRCSYAVHYHSNVFNSNKITGDPTKDFFSYLAPNFCPKSFLTLE